MGFGAGYQLAASLTGTSVYYSSTLTLGSTYLVVLKQEITVASATSGEATNSIFINPVIGESEPVANATKTESGITSLDCIKGIAFNQQPGLAAEIAGFRLSSTWENVVKSTGANAVINPEVKKPNVEIVSENEWKVNLNDISGNCHISVFNVQGQIMLQKDLIGGKENNFKVNVPMGLYIVLLKSDKDKYTTKVISK
jgi:hypothetical protein